MNPSFRYSLPIPLLQNASIQSGSPGFQTGGPGGGCFGLYSPKNESDFRQIISSSAPTSCEIEYVGNNGIGNGQPLMEDKGIEQQQKLVAKLLARQNSFGGIGSESVEEGEIMVMENGGLCGPSAGLNTRGGQKLREIVLRSGQIAFF